MVDPTSLLFVHATNLDHRDGGWFLDTVSQRNPRSLLLVCLQAVADEIRRAIDDTR